jgi:adenine-specific DNA-methyltransferase
MRMRAEVTSEKLRGGYYTPPQLVEFCLERVSPLLCGDTAIQVLEPSAGDGAFVRGLARTRSGIGGCVSSIHAIEIVPEEAAKAEVSLRSSGLSGRVERGSVLRWAADTDEWFGLVVGNPPFVRYQFLAEPDKTAIGRLGARLGMTFGGVANLWIPVLLGALARLRAGGAFALVLPTECFTGSSARVVREWLMREIDELSFDLFPPGSFPDVLQEVAVMSGRRSAETKERSDDVQIVEHSSGGTSRTWFYRPNPDERSWTRSLLDPRHLEAVDVACSLSTVARLSDVARLEVSIVTGANDFFCVDDEALSRHELRPWARPLLARARHSPGLVFRPSDHAAARVGGANAWLLDFDALAPNPQDYPEARRYLDSGAKLGLPKRYKCRIREPWYRVPSIRAGSLMLSKRSHLYPRLLMNRAGVYTTDTIYRGEVLAAGAISATDLVAGFHCSLTLLMVELEGRSFGGGVLELVPSEVSRLAVLTAPGLGKELSKLDRVARSREPEDLVIETDSLLAGKGLLPGDLLEVLAEARWALMSRRLQRNLGGDALPGDWEARAA